MAQSVNKPITVRTRIASPRSNRTAVNPTSILGRARWSTKHLTCSINPSPGEAWMAD